MVSVSFWLDAVEGEVFGGAAKSALSSKEVEEFFAFAGCPLFLTFGHKVLFMARARGAAYGSLPLGAAFSRHMR